jgi:homoaconitase/3-isopropylmalate dehydratase large subunit
MCLNTTVANHVPAVTPRLSPTAPSSCCPQYNGGACINAGPGVSKNADEVTISSQNRNFPGRSGPGNVYLASPTVVAIAAVAGRILSPSEFFNGS